MYVLVCLREHPTDALEDRRFQSGEATKAQNVGLPIQTISCFVIKDGHIVPRGGVGELGT